MNYQSFTVVQLKDKLRDRGLKVSGRKAELIARLEEDDRTSKESSSESEYDLVDAFNDEDFPETDITDWFDVEQPSSGIRQPRSPPRTVRSPPRSPPRTVRSTPRTVRSPPRSPPRTVRSPPVSRSQARQESQQRLNIQQLQDLEFEIGLNYDRAREAREKQLQFQNEISDLHSQYLEDKRPLERQVALAKRYAKEEVDPAVSEKLNNITDRYYQVKDSLQQQIDSLDIEILSYEQEALSLEETLRNLRLD